MKILNKLREHNALIYTGLNQAWKIVAGPLMLLLIPIYLTPEAQGFWFTIVSLSFMMIFADLGFSNIILQFSAHEYAFLSIDKNNTIIGSEDQLNRLSAFFKFTLKCVIAASIVVAPIISVISYFVLSSNPTNINWLLPWLIYTVGSIINYYNNGLLYFFEGCNYVSTTQKVRLVMSVVMTILMFIGLIFHLNLYALAFSLLLSAMFGFLYAIYLFKNQIMQLISIKYSFSWGKAVFPLIGRYAVSIASGYFIFQIFTPLMFYYHGAVEAGKIGISITVWSVIFGISSSWITSVTPRINMHISRNERELLDKLFKKRLLLSLLTFVICAGAFFIVLFLLQGKISILNRFADYASLLILAVSWFFQVIINAMAVYLRGHKEEPLMVLSFLSAIYITVTTILCAQYLPPSMFFLGFLSSYILGGPWVAYIFYKKKREVELSNE